MKIRNRYAPSPTGLQHIGGIRTALFNYLFAKSQGGAFILRMEDTDRARSDPAFVQNLFDTFQWLGFHWDEGPDIGGLYEPYTQSQRTAFYQKAAQELLDKDKAYYCFCSAERLENLRKEREATHSGETGYDRLCRNIPKDLAKSRVKSGEPYVVRLKIPLGQSTRFHDHLLGDIEWKNEDVNPDPVLLKSDGFPTYHLANVVDDHLMDITHVLRAQEWLPSTPLHAIIYESFGWNMPQFCHLPMVMGSDGKKLSKRHGATSIDEFRRQGYLPEALLNYTALLGASYEEGKDIYTLEEFAASFNIDKLNKAPAVFDYKKLDWFNGLYIRTKTNEELAELALPYCKGLVKENSTLFIGAMALIKERISLLSEIPSKIAYLFEEPPLSEPSEFFPKKADLAKTVELLELGKPLASASYPKNDEEAEAFFKEEAEKVAAVAGVKIGDVMMPLRVAITGARVSPPLLGSLRLLGQEKALARVEKSLSLLKAASCR
ncbi:MAG: glutamate--tRNA ligase [Treponema sp.]|jgi:glutamyl-tRNA synthetase|nr:glutamate--tRNA ligase [Treponema sp.]